jgi:hypothetical protein
MTLLDRIKQANKEVAAIRKELAKIQDYYTVPYTEMYEYYNIMKPKQAEKFIEGWVATLCGGKKIESANVPDEYKQNDNGDIWIGDRVQIGVNNIELKSSFKSDNGIGGGQFRFYENVPYYMLFKAWDNTRYEIFLLTKEQLINEIITRSQKTGRNSITSSQGSGVISKLTEDQKIDRLRKNLTGEFQDKLGWGFNPKTEPEYYQEFQSKYLITDVTAIKNKINGI